MKDDTTENKKYISSVLDLFFHPELLHKEGPATRSQVRESTWLQRVPHGKSTSKEVSQEEICTTSTTDSSATSSSEKR